MKNYLVGLIAVAASIAGPALAADIPARMPVKATPSQVVAFSWAGIYTSTSIGAARTQLEAFDIANTANTAEVSATRAWTGSHVGWQGQSGNFVYGIEGAYFTPLSSKFASSSFGPDCLAATNVAGATCHGRVHDIFTVGGKLGHSFGNWMIYGMGGYANGRVDTFGTLNGVNAFASSRERHDGWYAGAGVDWYVTRFMWSDLILGVEYRHIELSDTLHIDATTAAFNRNVRGDVDMVMAKATFKWVGAGPFSMFK